MTDIIVPARPARPIVVEGNVAPDITIQAERRLPPGGTTGQALIKASDSDFATVWGTASAAWGAISGTLSAQTDLQAALDAKQATLVSGTNIKTLNGSTILGSGDLVISASAAWGGITGTLSSQTDLQTALNAKANTSSLAAVATSGSAADLGTGTLPTARLPAFGSGDVSFAASGGAGTIAAGAVTLAKMANMATASLIYRKTAGSGAPEVNTLATLKTDLALAAVASSGSAADLTAGTLPAARMPALTGDATTTAGAVATTLATVNANVGSFGSATQVPTFTVNAKGLTTAAANVAISIPMTAISDSTAAGRAVLGAATATAQTALFDVFTSALKGLAPASGGGTTNFLRADGTWAAPPGGGGSSLTVQDEGSTLSTAVTSLNFVGAGVTATGTTAVTVTIPGGGSGGPPQIMSWAI